MSHLYIKTQTLKFGIRVYIYNYVESPKYRIDCVKYVTPGTSEL